MPFAMSIQWKRLEKSRSFAPIAKSPQESTSITLMKLLMFFVLNVEARKGDMLDTETIYQAYPRHKDKRFALSSIEKAIKRVMAGELCSGLTSRGYAAAHLLERTKAFAQSFAGQRGALTPYPATWFNRGGYMDDPEEWEYITPEEEKKLVRNIEANVGVWRP